MMKKDLISHLCEFNAASLMVIFEMELQDLSYVDFSYACITNVFFSRANLHCAKFRVGLGLTRGGNKLLLFPQVT